jgi:hypothetical protein
MSFKLIWSNVAEPLAERRSVGPYAAGMTPDEAEIGELVATFFAAFTSGPGIGERMDALRAALLPEAVIVKTCGAPAVYDVDGFLEPRRALLTGGTLTGFREWAEPGETRVYGDIAHHFCAYGKAGVQDGVAFTGRGMKTLQFVRTPGGWRISAAAWDDER